jgi:hypothetical protein
VQEECIVSNEEVGMFSFEGLYRLYIPDCLCGLVVRVTGYRSEGPVSIPGATRFSEK